MRNSRKQTQRPSQSMWVQKNIPVQKKTNGVNGATDSK